MSYGYHDENYRGGFQGRADSHRGSSGAADWDRVLANMDGSTFRANSAAADNAGFLVPNINPIPAEDRLPDRARGKLLGWREARDAAHVAYLPAADEARDAAFDVTRARAELAHMELAHKHINYEVNPARDRDGMPLPGIHPARAARLAQIADLEQRANRSRASKDLRENSYQVNDRLVAAVDSWLRTVPLTAKIIDVAPPKMPKAATVASVRADVHRLKAELNATLTSPLPSSVAKAAAADYVTRQANLGSPNVFPLVERGKPITWPAETVNADMGAVLMFGDNAAGPIGAPRGSARVKVHAVPAILCWLFPREMQARLNAAIDAVSDDARAMTVDQRKARVAELDAAILEAERVEAALVDQEGGEHRPDIDVRALLGVTVEA